MRASSLLFALLIGSSSAASADDERARQNYLLHCMGCHTESGEGLRGKVPSLRGTLAQLADNPEGRSYVLRIPGVTQSTLDADRLAEVLNWAIREFSDSSERDKLNPFSAAEVAEARSRPLLEVEATRQKLGLNDP